MTCFLGEEMSTSSVLLEVVSGTKMSPFCLKLIGVCHKLWLSGDSVAYAQDARLVVRETVLTDIWVYVDYVKTLDPVFVHWLLYEPLPDLPEDALNFCISLELSNMELLWRFRRTCHPHPLLEDWCRTFLRDYVLYDLPRYFTYLHNELSAPFLSWLMSP